MSPFLANFSFCFCPLSICERVHSLAAKIFCVCKNVRPSLIQTKNGSSPLPFLPVFLFFLGLGKKMFLFVFPIIAHFFAAVNTYAEKLSTGGRRRISEPARGELFGSAFPAFDSSRKSALVWLSGSKVSYCRFPFFCCALSAVGIFFVSLFRFPVKLRREKACSLMQ